MAASKLLTMPMLAFPQPLAEKYRPRTVEDFIGIEEPKAIMEAFAARPFPHAWYFHGPSGTGKTTLAMAVAEQMKAEIHTVPSRNCDLETIEHICRMCHYIPMGGGMHAIQVHEADQMTGAAQLALLSKLDATAWPPNTVFFFTANGTTLLEGRFLSRVSKVAFAMPSTAELAKYLAKIYRKEGGTYDVDFDGIAANSGGNVRDALNSLQVELLIGSKRKALPQREQEKEKCDHSHKCGECNVRVDCADQGCRKAAVIRQCPLVGSPKCGGVTTEGADRSRRAYQTRRDKKS